jgi:MFS transporter, PAT family, beta-lactamase induction signal transducer AmpG
LTSKNLLDTTNGRFLTFGILYISEGIPIGFTSVAMVAFMRQQGIPLDQIGAFVGAMFLPWAFKWAWAPLIDLIKLPRLGGRKAWILFCTSMMIVTLMVVAKIDFVANFELLLVMIVLNNIFCATQDIAIDSLAVHALKENERGRGNGFMFGGQYLGITLGGGAAIWVYGQYSFDVALAYISGLMAMNLLFGVFFVRDPHANPAARKESDVLRKLVANMTSFVKITYASFWKSGRGPIVGVAFALLPCGAMALAYATLSTIQVDYGLTENQIAAISIYNTVAAGLGCLFGGWLGDRLGLKKILAAAYALTTLPTLLLAMQIYALGLQAVPLNQLYAAILLHGVFFGMSFGVRNAVFMGMTNPAVAATQFTAFMGMGNLAISMGNYWQGIVAERFDYAAVLFLDSLIVLIPLCLIPFLGKRVEKEEPLPAGAVLVGKVE